MKKKLLAVLLCAAMVVTAVGCGSSSSSSDTTEAEETETEEAAEETEEASEETAETTTGGWTLGVNIQEFSNSFLSGMRTALQATADELGIELDMVDGESDTTVISGNIDLFLTKGYEILAINMMNTTDAADILAKTSAEGVQVVFFNVQPEDEVMEEYSDSYYVGAKAEESGTMQGEALVEWWNNNPDADRNGDGVMQYVMIMGDPGHQDSILRTEYSVAAITDAGIEVEELASVTANWARADGQSEMEAVLAAHDDIEVVISNNDEMALGAIEALKAAGYLVDGGEYIAVVGVDCNEEAQAAIEEGTMYSSVFNDGASQADAVVKLCELLHEGVTPTSENLGYDLDGQYVWVPYVAVTADNLDVVQ